MQSKHGESAVKVFIWWEKVKKEGYKTEKKLKDTYAFNKLYNLK